MIQFSLRLDLFQMKNNMSGLGSGEPKQLCICIVSHRFFLKLPWWPLPSWICYHCWRRAAEFWPLFDANVALCIESHTWVLVLAVCSGTFSGLVQQRRYWGPILNRVPRELNIIKKSWIIFNHVRKRTIADEKKFRSWTEVRDPMFK